VITDREGPRPLNHSFQPGVSPGSPHPLPALLRRTEFLFNERRFTYDDLMAIADSPLVGGRWQFRYWVSKIAQRPENRNKGRPELPGEFFNPRWTHIANCEKEMAIPMQARNINLLTLSRLTAAPHSPLVSRKVAVFSFW
jgi:hypothetical protein